MLLFGIFFSCSFELRTEQGNALTYIYIYIALPLSRERNLFQFWTSTWFSWSSTSLTRRLGSNRSIRLSCTVEVADFQYIPHAHNKSHTTRRILAKSHETPQSTKSLRTYRHLFHPALYDIVSPHTPRIFFLHKSIATSTSEEVPKHICMVIL